MRRSNPPIVGAATACFFVSGVAGLLYEVVWSRLLGLVFGHTVFAITTVLAAYMGGLALGSVLLGRWADRLRRPLLVYGALEAAVGLYCALTPIMFRGVDAAYAWAHRGLEPSAAGALALQFALSALVLVPPTALMGATLPVLSRAVVEHDRLAASQVGSLYATNTWGAVAGTALTGLVLLPSLGVRWTVWLGVALDLGVALVAVLLDRARTAAPRAIPAAQASNAAPTLPIPRHVVLGLAAIAVSGAASMAYQLAWTRTLSLALGSSTYAFTAMLTAFLVGLAGGALAVSRLLRRRRLDVVTFGALEIAIALVTVAMLPVFGKLPEAALVILGRTGVSYGAALGVQFALSFAVIIVPTLLIGATFPVMIAAVGRGVERLGRDIGLVYGANTVGTIFGSVAAGFFLIPWIGIQDTVRLAAAANLVAGVALVLVAGEGRRARAASGAALAAFAGLVAVVPHWDPRVMTSGVAVYANSYVHGGREAFRAEQQARELLFYSEGISTTVAVERTAEILGVRVNGKVDATNGPDMPTQLLLGHVGPLVHPEGRRALIIGLASGVTAGAMAQHPVERIDVAELEPAMRQVSRFFDKENRGAMLDPRLHVVNGDGRHVLAAAAEPYDVIVSEPSNPWIAGIANLFTRDFYELSRARLSERGVMVQWLQAYSIFTDDLRMVVRTFQEVFPHTSVWTAGLGDFLLVGTAEPLRLDLAAVAKRAAQSPGVREDLERYGWSDGDLVFRVLLDEEGARQFSAGAPLNTDDHPLLEFRAPLALYNPGVHENTAAMRAARVVERPKVSGLDPAALVTPAARLRAARSHWLLGWAADSDEELARTGPPEALTLDERIERARLLFLLGRFDEAAADLAAVDRLRPGDGTVRRYLRAAVELRGSPPADIAGATLERCQTRSDLDFCALAIEQIERELRVTPESVTSLNNYAGALYQVGDLAQATAALERALAIAPNLANTHYNLGVLLQKQGRLADAARAYEEVLRLDPSWAAARERLSAVRPAGN